MTCGGAFPSKSGAFPLKSGAFGGGGFGLASFQPIGQGFLAERGDGRELFSPFGSRGALDLPGLFQLGLVVSVSLQPFGRFSSRLGRLRFGLCRRFAGLSAFLGDSIGLQPVWYAFGWRGFASRRFTRGGWFLPLAFPSNCGAFGGGGGGVSGKGFQPIRNAFGGGSLSASFWSGGNGTDLRNSRTFGWSRWFFCGICFQPIWNALCRGSLSAGFWGGRHWPYLGDRGTSPLNCGAFPLKCGAFPLKCGAFGGGGGGSRSNWLFVSIRFQPFGNALSRDSSWPNFRTFGRNFSRSRCRRFPLDFGGFGLNFGVFFGGKGFQPIRNTFCGGRGFLRRRPLATRSRGW